MKRNHICVSTGIVSLLLTLVIAALSARAPVSVTPSNIVLRDGSGGTSVTTVYCASAQNSSLDSYVQIYRMLVQNGSSFPSEASSGYLFFRTDYNQLTFRDGTAWTNCSTSGGGGGGVDDDNMYLLSADASNFLFQNGTRPLTTDWNTGAFGVYGITWVNNTPISTLGFYWNGLNRTDAVANPVGPFSYIIDVVGSSYRMINQTTGQVDYQSTDGSAVLINANGNLTNGGIIHVKGTVVGTKALNLNNNVVLEGDGAGTVLVNNAVRGIDHFIGAIGTADVPVTGVQIRNLQIIYNATGATGDVIKFSHANNSVVENVVMNATTVCEEGIVAYYSTFISFRNNWLYNLGNALNDPLELFDSKFCIVKDNFLNCTNSGAAAAIALTGDTGGAYNPSENNIVEGNIMVDSQAQGILLTNNARYNKILNNIIIDSASDGILINGGAGYSEVRGNTIVNSKGHGMNVLGAHNQICENTINTTGYSNYGIRIYRVNYSEIQNNKVLNAGSDGIYINHASNTLISGNTVENARGNPGSGINLMASDYNIISGNNITNNHDGVHLYSSSYNTVSGNNIVNHNQLGVSLEKSSGNSFFHNNLINNTKQVSMGYPSGYVNSWDDGYPSGGNYWSDYAGTDANHDGMGDTPYVIDANNVDHYPLVNEIIPEFPPGAILLFFMIAALMTVEVYTRATRHRHSETRMN